MALRKRHDASKLLLRRLLVWAGIPVTCEVFNLFASSIPQEGLNRLEGGRRRQGLVPDFHIPVEGGGELKCISASSTRYPPRSETNFGVPGQGKADRLGVLWHASATSSQARRAAACEAAWSSRPTSDGGQCPGRPCCLLWWMICAASSHSRLSSKKLSVD